MAEPTRSPARLRERTPRASRTSRLLDVSSWLGHLVSHIPAARDGDDPEGVHQLRVAAGRLDVWLRMARRRALRDDLRWLRRAAAPVRDLDVFLARDLPTGCASDARIERARRRRALSDALDDRRLAGLLEALSLLPPLPLAEARRARPRLRARLVERGGSVATPEELHAFRRALRRYRYCLEWLGAETAPLKELQDALGASNDAAIALRFDFRGAEAVRRTLARERARERRRAIGIWSRLKGRLP